MSFELESILKLLAALLCGGLIGYEREFKHRPAGLRTHILVCMGAALVMVVAQFMLNNGTGGNIDTTRMGSAVISGIGFLGAGTIIRERFGVKGLTTAASLWTMGCIGVAIGAGYFLLAGITTLIIFVSLILFRKFEKLMKIKPDKAKIKLTAVKNEKIDEVIQGLMEQSGYIVKGMKFSKSFDNERVTFIYDVQCPDETSWADASRRFYENDDIYRVDIEY